VARWWCAGSRASARPRCWRMRSSQRLDCALRGVAGVESEMELAFAALQQLCAPMLDDQECLPDPQRDALGIAFGLKTGEAPDRFLVVGGRGRRNPQCATGHRQISHPLRAARATTSNR